MRLMAKRPKVFQNIHPHVEVSEIMMNSLDFDDNENGSSDLRPSFVNKISTNGLNEMKFSTFTQMPPSMQVPEIDSFHSNFMEMNQIKTAQFSYTGQIKPLF